MKASICVRQILWSVVLCAAISTSLVAHAATSTMEQIKQTKQFRIGVAPGDPWYFKDPMTGQWTGVGVMMGQQIAKDLGAQLVTVETTYGNAVAGLQANQMDAMFVLDATDERKKALDFPANPMLWYKQGVLIRPGVNASTWDALNNSNVHLGVSLGTATDRDLTKRLPNAHIERFANTDEAVAAFMAGRIDGIAFYHPALVIAYSHIHKGTVVVPTPVVALPTSAGIRKESDPAFKDFLNKEFAKYYNDGTVQRMYADYLKTKGIDPSTVPTVMEKDAK
ncbi:transporter substrate-binding domain-containing protein [Paraburkholderia sediminicola]|uniref:transporter substrate-binding domain-containing protein n=1 Tax=Paraburkholderia sediminicola TaxID=458836 RepID=UPI0038BC2BAC